MQNAITKKIEVKTPYKYTYGLKGYDLQTEIKTKYSEQDRNAEDLKLLQKWRKKKQYFTKNRKHSHLFQFSLFSYTHQSSNTGEKHISWHQHSTIADTPFS